MNTNIREGVLRLTLHVVVVVLIIGLSLTSGSGSAAGAPLAPQPSDGIFLIQFGKVADRKILTEADEASGKSAITFDEKGTVIDFLDKATEDREQKISDRLTIFPFSVTLQSDVEGGAPLPEPGGMVIRLVEPLGGIVVLSIDASSDEVSTAGEQSDFVAVVATDAEGELSIVPGGIKVFGEAIGGGGEALFKVTVPARTYVLTEGEGRSDIVIVDPIVITFQSDADQGPTDFGGIPAGFAHLEKFEPFDGNAIYGISATSDVPQPGTSMLFGAAFALMLWYLRRSRERGERHPWPRA